jgi:hypothetical protein
MQARLRVELTDRHGTALAVRHASNSVMQGGAVLVARLFAGAEGAAPITHMGVGTSDAPEGAEFTSTALSNGPPPLQGDVEAPVPTAAFTISTDPARRVAVVRVRGTLPDGAAVGTVREAGLLARNGGQSVLYNRVTFAPLDKGGDHELTLFWEVTFPYGDLQWLL